MRLRVKEDRGELNEIEFQRLAAHKHADSASKKRANCFGVLADRSPIRMRQIVVPSVVPLFVRIALQHSYKRQVLRIASAAERAIFR